MFSVKYEAMKQVFNKRPNAPKKKKQKKVFD
jgi:hypothetical protein